VRAPGRQAAQSRTRKSSLLSAGKLSHPEREPPAQRVKERVCPPFPLQPGDEQALIHALDDMLNSERLFHPEEVVRKHAQKNMETKQRIAELSQRLDARLGRVHTSAELEHLRPSGSEASGMRELQIQVMPSQQAGLVPSAMGVNRFGFSGGSAQYRGSEGTRQQLPQHTQTRGIPTHPGPQDRLGRAEAQHRSQGGSTKRSLQRSQTPTDSRRTRGLFQVGSAGAGYRSRADSTEGPLQFGVDLEDAAIAETSQHHTSNSPLLSGNVASHGSEDVEAESNTGIPGITFEMTSVRRAPQGETTHSSPEARAKTKASSSKGKGKQDEQLCEEALPMVLLDPTSSRAVEFAGFSAADEQTFIRHNNHMALEKKRRETYGQMVRRGMSEMTHAITSCVECQVILKNRKGCSLEQNTRHACYPCLKKETPCSRMVSLDTLGYGIMFLPLPEHLRVDKTADQLQYWVADGEMDIGPAPAPKQLERKVRDSPESLRRQPPRTNTGSITDDVRNQGGNA
jgi:hypothetical protein